MEKLYIVAHCSDSAFGNAALLTKWHVLPVPKGNGWSNIGYHLVILNGHLSSDLYNYKYDGHVETGRPLDTDDMLEKAEYGAHVYGFNHRSIGVCMIGKSDDFTNHQLESLITEIKKLKRQFQSRYDITVCQHSDLDDKKPFCAGIHPDLMKSLNQM